MEISFWVQISTIIAGISTLIYTIVTFRTLFEIKSQRESMYYPEILIANQEFFFYFDRTVDEETPEFDNYDFVSEKYIEKDNIEKKIFPEIKMYNIGLGAAKNIKLKLYYNPVDLISIIERTKNYLCDDYVYFDQIDSSNNTISFESYQDVEDGDFISDIPFCENVNKEKVFNFCLPYKDSLGSLSVTIPHILKILISHSIRNYILERHPDFKNKDKQNNNIGGESNDQLELIADTNLLEKLKPSLPDLYLDLEYKDINDKVYRREYVIKINYQITSLENDCSVFNIVTDLRKSGLRLRLKFRKSRT
jgi:hypothetical protein